MNREITRRGKAGLPAEVSTEIRQLTTSPAIYLKTLPSEGVADHRPPGAVTLSHLRRTLDRSRQIYYLELLIAEVNDFFNVKGKMGVNQMRLTAELILDNLNFHDLSLGNIKACFRQRMMSEKLYDRLDGNIIIGWLREFKSEMSDWCETVSEGMDQIRQRKETQGNAGCITHAVYMSMLESRANDGDREAAGILEAYRRRAAIPSPEETRRKDLGFFVFNQQYKKSQGYYDKDKTETKQ